MSGCVCVCVQTFLFMPLFVQRNKGFGFGFTKHKAGGVNTVGWAWTGVSLQDQRSRFVSRWERTSRYQAGLPKAKFSLTE